MSDKLKELTPILVSFVQGESPTPNKLENSFGQVATAMNILERAVGDIWNQNSITDGPLDLNPNYIANLSRAIGNMSSMNPKSLGGNVIGIINEVVPTGKKLFALAHAPDDPATPAAITFTNPTGVFEDLKASIAAMVEDGDYFIDPSGLVYTFAETVSHNAAYDYTTVTDSYSGATYNVIPNPSQDAAGDRCDVVTSGSGYIITLPIDTDSGSENHDQQLTLPSDLSVLEVDDEIPAGFIYIWDNSENTIIEGFTFKKQATLNSVYAEGNESLDIGASRYSVITVGSQIAKMMEGLRDLILSHDHMDNQTQFIDHTKILGSDAVVAHGTVSAIMGIDDIQTVTNKTLVDPLFFDTGGAGFVTNVIIRVFEGEVAFRNSLDTEYQPLNLNCIPADLSGKSADQVDGIHASATPVINQLLALDAVGVGEFPNSVLKTGHGKGIDADTLDTQHAPAGTIVGTTDAQVLTNKELTTPNINGSIVTTATGAQMDILVGGGTTFLHNHGQVFTELGGPAGTKYTYSSGTGQLIIPANTYYIFVAAWGGGAGGNGARGGHGDISGPGGGGAGFAASILQVTPTDVIDTTVGAGGATGWGDGNDSFVQINSVTALIGGKGLGETAGRLGGDGWVDTGQVGTFTAYSNIVGINFTGGVATSALASDAPSSFSYSLTSGGTGQNQGKTLGGGASGGFAGNGANGTGISGGAVAGSGTYSTALNHLFSKYVSPGTLAGGNGGIGHNHANPISPGSRGGGGGGGTRRRGYPDAGAAGKIVIVTLPNL